MMQIRSIAYLLIAGMVALVSNLVPSNAALAQADSETTETAENKEVLGWVENIRLFPDRMLMKAKLDPGAKSSAIHAESIEEFEDEGRQMVRFTILADHDDADSEQLVMERPLVGEVRIKLRNTERRDERMVVRLEFCLAGERYNSLFSLTDRSNFNYPVLLGREFLSNKILVDSSQSFTHKTRCPS